jgi:hypothetical protein
MTPSTSENLRFYRNLYLGIFLLLALCYARWSPVSHLLPRHYPGLSYVFEVQAIMTSFAGLVCGVVMGRSDDRLPILDFGAFWGLHMLLPMILIQGIGLLCTHPLFVGTSLADIFFGIQLSPTEFDYLELLAIGVCAHMTGVLVGLVTITTTYLIIGPIVKKKQILHVGTVRSPYVSGTRVFDTPVDDE